MDSWMSDVKVVRIPRPKFASGGGGGMGAAGVGSGAVSRRGVHGSSGATSRYYPTEPPTDYSLEGKMSPGATALDRATEELRRAVQEKL